MKHLTIFGSVLLLILGRSAHAQNDKLQVVASFSILGDVVQNVAGDAADVHVVMPVGTDPHTFQPSPQDVAGLIEADVVFTNGVAFEESLLDVIAASAEDINLVVVSSCVPILSNEGHEHSDEEEDHAHETASTDFEAPQNIDLNDFASLCQAHSDEILGTVGHFPHYYEETLGQLYSIDCEAGEHQEGDEHDHGACDPHVWTDPHNVFWWVLIVRDHLIQLDPANAQIYADNAAAYIAQLDETIHGLAEPLHDLPEERKILVSNHNNFGYMAALTEFQTVEAVIEGGGTTAEPSAGDFADLIRSIIETGAPAIFAENTVSTNLIDQLSDETGVPVYLLYTDSLSPAEGEAATYLDYITYNYQTIFNALSE